MEKSDLSSHWKSCRWVDEFQYRFPPAFLPWMTHDTIPKRPTPPRELFKKFRSIRERTVLPEGWIHDLVCTRESITLSFCCFLCVFMWEFLFFVCSSKLYVSVCEGLITSSSLQLCLPRLELLSYHPPSHQTHFPSLSYTFPASVDFMHSLPACYPEQSQLLVILYLSILISIKVLYF